MYLGWRQKGRIIAEVVEVLKKYDDTFLTTETNSDDEVTVKKEMALYILGGHPSFMQNLILAESQENLRNLIQNINEEISYENSRGCGWNADVWNEVVTVLGHHLS